MRLCKNYEKGVTLIELMLAFSLLAFAVLSASGMLSYGYRGTTKDFREVEAVQLLTDRMNRLSTIPFKVLNDYLTRAGADSFTFADPIEGIEFGEVEMPKSKNKYRVTATLKRQPISFPPIMALQLPNPTYRSNDVQTWEFTQTPEIKFDGKSGPFKVIKITVSVQILEERNKVVKALDKPFRVISFVADLE